jgi:putative ABC transport system permease protein
VLKTLGYGNALILGLVLAESLVIAVTGGAVGLLLAWLVSRQGDPTGGLLPAFFFPPEDMILGVALVVGLGIAAGLLPAVRAMRLKIVDALRRS